MERIHPQRDLDKDTKNYRGKSILMNIFNDTVTISETVTEDEQRILRARKMSHLAARL